MSAEGTTRPFPIILSAPSGVGKTTVANEMLKQDPRLRFSVSLTTRPRREGEIDDGDYRFVNATEFERAKDADELAEWAVVHGHLYGTPRAEIAAALAEGFYVLLDVDVQGGVQLMRAYPDAVSIFLLPPSHAVLEERLQGRGTESPEAIQARVDAAMNEIDCVADYQYVIVNEEVQRTVEVFASIIRAEEHRRARRDSLHEWIGSRFPDRGRVDAICGSGGNR